jgi:hypothetical protein
LQGRFGGVGEAGELARVADERSTKTSGGRSGGWLAASLHPGPEEQGASERDARDNIRDNWNARKRSPRRAPGQSPNPPVHGEPMSAELTSGVLLTTDEQTVVYLTLVHEVAPPERKFILKALDATTLLVRAERMATVNAALQQRLSASIFEEEDARDAPPG